MTLERAAAGPLPPLGLDRPAEVRRASVVEAYSEHVYGRTPVGGGPAGVVLESSSEVAPGVSREQWAATVTVPGGSLVLHLLVHRPTGVAAAPAFLGLNFKGNHATVKDDPTVRVATVTSWMPRVEGLDMSQGLPTSAREGFRLTGWDEQRVAPRGAEAAGWPWREVVGAGFALVTLHAGDVEPDGPEGGALGVRGWFERGSRRADDHWGAIGAWAWGLSRALDALADVPGIDETRVGVIGHSRLGKAALWAALQDLRFALVVSNDSGCGGAALFRGKRGEDVRAITTLFPGWFAPRLAAYAGVEDRLPLDQHHLLAALAPRPTYVASASDDVWADPANEFLATVHATPAFVAAGHTGTADVAGDRDVSEQEAAAVPFPPLDIGVGGRLSYHCRTGGHEITPDDWRHYLAFAAHRL